MPTAHKGRVRGPNVKPTRQAVAAYYELLKRKAEQGNVNAAGWLLQLDLLNQPREGQ
ncbi:hypothetical protein HOP51_08600 [Halomonas sp. MCCC 1A11036]|uniref:Uncharacterized protein n=1 Tax=Billgrantia zhangzhouensis TaxID=2733481 RepID=A0ABS9AEK3_9GAMM|nr:hypothetical protein [Halomonas zhangzhouensis]MCE8020173.1 hypothetical protein [Halomonas zhangzhouensis]NIC38726.1 hypothetical protein [Halomonas desiderata]